MPGRRVSKQTKSRRAEHAATSKRRSLDALALAEEQVPSESKIRKNRVRDLVDSNLGQRQTSPLEASDREEIDRRPKRQKTAHDSTAFAPGIEDDEVDSDLDVRIGEVASDDDSSLNSDDAFGDGDAEAFKKFKFRGSSSAGPMRPSFQASHSATKGFQPIRGSDSEQSDSQSYGDIARANTDLSHDATKNSQGSFAADNHARDFESEASEGFEDEADSILSMSDLDDGTAEPQKLKRLQALAASLGNEPSGGDSAQALTDSAQEAATPSEFGIKPRQRLSVADLLPTVTDLQARKALRMMIDNGKRPKGSAVGVPGRLDVPLAKRKQDRLDRAAAYEKSKETLSRWIETVKRNRRAEHLMFPLPDADESSSKNARRLPPTTSSNPVTDLEGTIKSILTESGMVAANSQSQDSKVQEAEQLAANRLPLEEIQAKRAELRRHRDLLFREEIRAKRIKKIKSKAYRRVHRKERERNLLREKEALAAAGLVPEGEEERLDRMRAEERMSSRHRESKWAKSTKEAGRQAWDGETRNELTEMARRNEELRKRIQGQSVHDSEGSSDSASDSEASLDGERPGSHPGTLFQKLETLKSGVRSVASSHLASLKFMQKADAVRKAHNDAEIEDIRRELGGEASTHAGTLEEPATGRRRYGPQPSEEEPTVRKKASINEFEEALGSDDEGEGADDPGERVQVTTEKIVSPGPTGARTTESVRGTSKRTDQSRKPSGPASNPWLVRPSDTTKPSSRAAEESVVVVNSTTDTDRDGRFSVGLQTAENRPLIPLETSMPQPTGQLQGLLFEPSDADTEPSFNGFSSPNSPRDPVVSHTQKNEDLIRRAFASDDVLAASSFAAEKAVLAKDDSDDQEDAARDSERALPGWGSWTGAGLPKRDRKRPSGSSAAKNGQVTREAAQKLAKEEQPRQDRGLANVIISQKRVPKTARFLATALPRPYETRTQYERSLRLPLGREWVAGETFRNMVRPRVETKAGEVIDAMSRPIA